MNIIYKALHKQYKIKEDRAIELAKYLYKAHTIYEINNRFEWIKFKRKDLI